MEGIMVCMSMIGGLAIIGLICSFFTTVIPIIMTFIFIIATIFIAIGLIKYIGHLTFPNLFKDNIILHKEVIEKDGINKEKIVSVEIKI